tara:strand:- start:1771 stop:3216 length:1446 start_codon:yes stop_codon:yes gene_type:complete
MTTTSKPISKKLLASFFIITSIFLNHFTQARMNYIRSDIGLTRMEPLKNAPPMLAFSSVALGGFRGLIANFLWARATRLQENGRFFEALSLADWITKLQPTYPSVWTFQSWNMAYNISKQFEDHEDRWRWVQSAITLLRDQALQYNPESTEIYRELAWIFQDKIGANLDNSHLYYKQIWASDMKKIFGTNPDFDAILLSKDPEILAMTNALKASLGLEIKVIKRIQDSLGPFDWRLPETHAIYWAWVGLENAHKGQRNFLRRIIWQSMAMAFERGRIVEHEEEAKSATLEFAPNLDLAPYTHAMFKKIRKEEENPNYYSTIDRAHNEFLQNATYYFYLHHQIETSKLWFEELNKRFPDALPTELTLEEFALNRFEKNLIKADMNQAGLIIEGMIRKFLFYLAINEEDRALGYSNLSQLAWKRHQQRVEKAKAADRLALPEYDELLSDLLNRILKGEEGFTDSMIAVLKTRISFTDPETTEE